MVEISSRLYLRSHGEEPRGRGSWWFLVMDDSSSPAREHDVLQAPASTLAAAKRWAKATARERFPAEVETGHLYLEVAP